MKIGILVIAFSTLSWASLAGAQTVTVPSEIDFAESADVRDAVRQECELQTLLPEYIADEADRDLEIVLSDDISAATGRVFTLEISSVLAPGGGRFSGPKSVTVRGELREDGEVIGTVRASRFTTRGTRTCTMLNRIVRALGEDLATWLLNPEMDTELGN